MVQSLIKLEVHLLTKIKHTYVLHSYVCHVNIRARNKYMYVWMYIFRPILSFSLQNQEHIYSIFGLENY